MIKNYKNKRMKNKNKMKINQKIMKLRFNNYKKSKMKIHKKRSINLMN